MTDATDDLKPGELLPWEQPRKDPKRAPVKPESKAAPTPAPIPARVKDPGTFTSKVTIVGGENYGNGRFEPDEEEPS